MCSFVIGHLGIVGSCRDNGCLLCYGCSEGGGTVTREFVAEKQMGELEARRDHRRSRADRRNIDGYIWGYELNPREVLRTI